MKLCQHFHGRGGTIYFCLRKLGHDGDHRGSGAQWTKRGARVSPPTITLSSNGEVREKKPVAKSAG